MCTLDYTLWYIVYTYTTFYIEFYNYITYNPLSNNSHNFILGDFNYHFESNILPHSTFKNVTDSLSLHQCITFHYS